MLREAVDFTFLLASTAPAESGGDSGSDWQKTISWALGLPVSIVAAVGSVQLWRKNPLEQRKLQLDILEKERALGLAKDTSEAGRVATIVAEPILETQRTQVLILRFVLLSVMLMAWGLVANLLGAALSGAQFGLDRAITGEASIAAVSGYLAVALIAAIPSVVRSLLIVLIGWPLLLDIADALRFELPQYFYSPHMRTALLLIAVAAALAQTLLGTSYAFFRF